MQLTDIDYCCSAYLICDFEIEDYRLEDDNGDIKIDYEDWDDDFNRYKRNAYLEGIGMLVAITTRCQTEGIKQLKKHGFKRVTRWINKRKHPETQTAIWVYIVFPKLNT